MDNTDTPKDNAPPPITPDSQQTNPPGLRTLPTAPDWNKEVRLYKMQNGNEEHAVIDTPLELFGDVSFMPDSMGVTATPPTIKGLVEIDNKQQFLSALFIEGTTETDKAARETIAAYMGDILNRLAGQAIRKEPIDYQYTSEIVAEAISKARAAGINAPYIDALEEMQKPAPPPEQLKQEQLPLFEMPPDTKAKDTAPSGTDIVTVQQAQMLAADAKTRYPAPPYVRPDTIGLPTANLARNIHTADMKANPNRQVSYPVDKRPHSHYVFMTMLNKIGEQYPIAPIDKNILIALGNLYAQRKADGKTGIHGGAIITAADMIRLYRGYDAHANIDSEEIKAIQDRIEYLRGLDVAFDFTQHFQYNNVGDEVQLSIPDDMRIQIPEQTASQQPQNLIKRAQNGLTVVRFSYRGHMINADVIEVEYDNGTVVTAYELLTPPIVYEYAEKIRQIQKVETKLLDLRKRANSSRDTDIIKIYLLEQINAMRHDKTNRTTRILLDTLFSDMRIEITSRAFKKTKVDIVKRILTHFRDTPLKNGKPLIAGFTEVIEKRHRAIIGYDIHITEEKNTGER